MSVLDLPPEELAEILKEAEKIAKRKKKVKAVKPKKKAPAEYDSSKQARKPQFSTLKEWETFWEGKRRECPKCGKSKLMVEEFSAKPMRGVYYVQSWCRTCRATTNYNNRPRKYQTRNSG
jgi:hypothetical protein